MRNASGITLVSALATAFVATAASAQSDGRIFDAMRTADNGRAASVLTVVAPGELAQLRGTSEPRADANRVPEYVLSGAPAASTGMRGAPAVSARVIESGAAPRAEPQAAPPTPEQIRNRARAAAEDEKARAKGAVFYATESRGEGGAAGAYITENQRAMEHARYEANKRRGLNGEAVAAAAQARQRVIEQARSGGGIASVSSAPLRTAVVQWSDGPTPVQARPETIGTSGGAASVYDQQPAAPDQITPGDAIRARAILSGLR